MRRVLLVVLLGVVAGASGCMGTAVSQGVSTVTGASPRFYELRPIAGPAALDRYKSAEVLLFDASPLLGALPAEAVTETQMAVIRRLIETKMFESVGPTAARRPALVIRGRFVDYDPGGSPGRVVGFGENPLLTAQIEIVDGDTHQVIGAAIVSGTVKSLARTGMKEQADGVAKAIRGLVSHHHTKVREEETPRAGDPPKPEKKGFKFPWDK